MIESSRHLPHGALAEEAAGRAASAEEKVNILLVDDREENLFALEAILRDLGHTLIKATSGQQALEFLLENDAAVILLDVRMPVMDGLETADLIRKRKRSRHTPIIFLTAIDASPDHVARGYSVGAVDYIFKPFRPEVLKSKVSVFLELYKKSEQLRRQAEQLRASEQRFRTLVQNIPGVLYRLTPGTPPRIHFISDPIEGITGYPVTEFLLGKRSLPGLIHADDVKQVTSSLARALNDRLPYALEYRIVRRDGVVRWVIDRGQAVAGLEGKALWVDGVLFDTTDRKEAEDQLRKRTAELESVNRELEAFSYSVSHDLRAPLRAMHGFSEALLEDYGDRVDATGREFLQRIGEASRRMDLLIQDLLLYSRLTRTEIQLRSVKLSAAVEEVRAAMKTELHERRASVEVVEPLPAVVAHDVTLRQVLTNLLSNAAKFVAPGVEPRVRLWSEVRGAAVRLWVEDNGIGIAPEHCDRIFRVFERLNNVEAYPGTGIGLAIVRKAMERMDGQAGVESQPGKGSRFWIELPHSPS